MAKITFPSVADPDYRGAISELRTALTRVASFAEKSPGANVDIGAQVDAMLEYMVYVGTLPPLKAIVANGDVVVVTQGTATFTVVANVITSVAIVP